MCVWCVLRVSVCVYLCKNARITEGPTYVCMYVCMYVCTYVLVKDEVGDRPP